MAQRAASSALYRAHRSGEFQREEAGEGWSCPNAAQRSAARLPGSMSGAFPSCQETSRSVTLRGIRRSVRGCNSWRMCKGGGGGGGGGGISAPTWLCNSHSANTARLIRMHGCLHDNKSGSAFLKLKLNSGQGGQDSSTNYITLTEQKRVHVERDACARTRRATTRD